MADTREVHIFDCYNCMLPNTKYIKKNENKILLKQKKFIMKYIQLMTEMDIFGSSMYTYSKIIGN
jgi:hypothetical protein